MLVEMKIVDKVKIGFMLVGHTHDQIDQMFSTISKKLARNDAFTLIHMMDLVRDSYTPQLKVHHLIETYDFRRFVYGVEGEECCIKRLNDLSFQHQFLIKRKDCNKSFLY